MYIALGFTVIGWIHTFPNPSQQTHRRSKITYTLLTKLDTELTFCLFPAACRPLSSRLINYSATQSVKVAQMTLAHIYRHEVMLLIIMRMTGYNLRPTDNE